ncbi:DUF397 domain-containing protein [Nocardiopsis coralliicola]
MPEWRKSSYSGGNGGDCVEAAVSTTSLIRDTRHREAGHLEVDAAEWRAFLTAVRAHQL